MTAVIYNRVSSPSQNTYGKTVSLAMQESICNKFAHDNKLRIVQIMKEIRRASGTSSPLLKKLIENTRTKNILFMDVSRFSRNVDKGLEVASKAIANGIKLIFIHEKFVCKTADDLPMMKTFILKTEEESKVIGRRITAARNHLMAQGLHPGGVVAFGYELKMSDSGNRPVPNEYEQNTIAFIKICQSTNIRSTDLNFHMKKLVDPSTLNIYVNIDCYNNNGDRVLLIDKMSNSAIATLLNEYSITKRGKSWTSSSIKTAMNGNSYVLNTLIPDEDHPFNFQSFTSSLADTEDTKKSKTPRSQRSHNIDLSESSSYEPPLSRARIDSNISNTSSESLDTDMQLFAEFTAFKKMINRKK